MKANEGLQVSGEGERGKAREEIARGRKYRRGCSSVCGEKWGTRGKTITGKLNYATGYS